MDFLGGWWGGGGVGGWSITVSVCQTVFSCCVHKSHGFLDYFLGGGAGGGIFNIYIISLYQTFFFFGGMFIVS